MDQGRVQTAIGSLVQTDVSGAQLPNYKYPDYWTYAFLAETPDCRQVATSAGLMLTASIPTTLMPSIEKEKSSFKHVISVSLKSGGSGAVNRSIRILVNGTVKRVLATGSDGQFSSELNLEPLNNKPATYRIVVSFEGDTAHTATAYGTTPNGTRYAICTTIHYGFKPSSDSTTLTVSPQSTEATTPTKTPEQMEQDARASGWLTVWHEFTWWYPWYRLHLVLNGSLPQGRLHMDYGWTLLPFGQTFYTATPEVMATVFNELAVEIAEGLFLGYLTGKLIQHGAALLLGKTLIGVVVAIATYVGYSVVETALLYLESGNDPIAWLAAFIVSAISGTYGLFKAGLEKLIDFLTALAREVLRKISHIMNSFWARGLDFFDITGIAFSLTDLAFAALYLNQLRTLGA